MPEFIKKRWFQVVALIVIVITCILVSKYMVPTIPSTSQNLVADIGTKQVTALEFQSAINRRLNRTMAVRGKVSSAERESVMLSVFKEMMNDKILEQSAEELGVVVTPADVMEKVNELKQRLGVELNNMVAKSGAESTPQYSVDDMYSNLWSTMGFRNESEFIENLKHEVYEEKLSKHLFPEDSFSVSNEEINSFIPRIKAQQIYLIHEQDKPSDEDINYASKNQEKKAWEIYQKIKNGADFTEMAKQYSQESAAANGGFIGWVNKSVVVPEYWEVASNLQPGDITEPFQTPYGIHILKCLDRREPEDEIFSGIRDVIIRTILTRKRQKSFVGWFYKKMVEMEQNGSIVLHHPVLKANMLRNMGDYDGAIEEYRKAIIEDSTGAPYYHLDIAITMSRQKRFSEALREIRIATDKGPTDPLLFFALGESYMEVGEHAKALTEFKKASDMSKLDYELHRKLMQIFTQLGLIEDAETEQQRMQHAIELLGGTNSAYSPGSMLKSPDIAFPGDSRQGSNTIREPIVPEGGGIPIP